MGDRIESRCVPYESICNVLTMTPLQVAVNLELRLRGAHRED